MEIGSDRFIANPPSSHCQRSACPAVHLRPLLEEIALADQPGLGVFGTGEHHRPGRPQKAGYTPDDLLRLDMPRLDAVAPIIWAKWGSTFLEALRQESLDAADGLAFRAMNSEAGIRTLLIACTTNRAQIQTIEQALPLNVVARAADWESYSAAEMIFKTEKGSGLSHQERRDGNARTSLVLCATRPGAVQTIEKLFDLPG